MPSRRSKSTIVTNPNPAASRLPRQRGAFASSPPPPDPVTPLPRQRPGEIFRDSASVQVTNKATRAQRPKGGQF